MEEEYCEGVQSVELKLPFGHNVSFVLFTRRPTKFIQRVFDINCCRVPMTWLFETEIRPHPDCNKIAFPVRLMRVDFMERPVDAFITFKVFDHEFSILSEGACFFRKDTMHTDHEIEGTFVWPTMQPETANLIVTFSIITHYCHSEKTEGSAILKKFKQTLFHEATLPGQKPFIMNIPFGHRISYLFKTPNSSKFTERIFHINCCNGNMLWVFDMKIHAHPDTNMFTFPVSLTRIDDMAIPVDVIIGFKVYDDEHRILYDSGKCVKFLHRDKVLRNDVLKGTFKWPTIQPETVNLSVVISITMGNCHKKNMPCDETVVLNLWGAYL